MNLTPSTFFKFIGGISGYEQLVSRGEIPDILGKIKKKTINNYRKLKEIEILHNEPKKIEGLICKYFNCTKKERGVVSRKMQDEIRGCNLSGLLEFLDSKSRVKINKAFTNVKIDGVEIDVIYKDYLIDIKSYKQINNSTLLAGLFQIIIYYNLIKGCYNVRKLCIYIPTLNNVVLIDVKGLESVYNYYLKKKCVEVKNIGGSKEKDKIIKDLIKRVERLEKIISKIGVALKG
jgi:hypothetical protein